MKKFKVGDRVVINNNSRKGHNNHSDHGPGYEFVIEEVVGGIGTTWYRETKDKSTGIKEDVLDLVYSPAVPTTIGTIGYVSTREWNGDWQYYPIGCTGDSSLICVPDQISGTNGGVKVEGVYKLNNQKNMQTLTAEQKSILPEDIQEQIKAGLRNTDLSLTATGISIISGILATKNAKEFTAAAKEIVESKKVKS